jgi:crotonobetaine/carnitine-CoA ligase
MVNVNDLLEKRTMTDGRKPFCWFQGQPIDFMSLAQSVNRSVNSLGEFRLEKGDHVCLFLPNCLEYLYLWLALAKIGVVIVTADINLDREKLRHVIHHCDAKLIVLDEDTYLNHAFVETDFAAVKNKIWHGKRGKPPSGFVSLSDLTESADGETHANAQVNAKDLLGIRYTRDHRGLPKGVMMSHESCVRSVQFLSDAILSCGEEDVFLITQQLSQGGVYSLIPLCSLYTGRPTVLEESFSPTNFLDQIKKYRVTIFGYTGELLKRLSEQPELHDDFDNPVRVAFGEGAPPDLWEKFEERFNLRILEGYGLAETEGFCLCNSLNNSKVGSVGRPTHSFDVNIWDANNQEIPLGYPGEIVIQDRGISPMFSGYYKQRDKTMEAWEENWFHTGDTGYQDEEGYFYVVNRDKR